MVLDRVPLPNRLPVLRAERGISQSKVAAALKMSHNRYWKIENGHVAPTDGERVAIAEAFAVAADQIWPVGDAAASEAEAATGTVGA